MTHSYLLHKIIILHRQNRCELYCCTYFHIKFRFDCMFRLRFAWCQNFSMAMISFAIRVEGVRGRNSNRTNVIILSSYEKPIEIFHIAYFCITSILRIHLKFIKIFRVWLCVLLLFLLLFSFFSFDHLSFANIIGQWHFTRAKFWLGEWDSVCFFFSFYDWQFYQKKKTINSIRMLMNVNLSKPQNSLTWDW